MSTEAQMRSRLAEIDERLPAIARDMVALTEGEFGDDEAARFDAFETEHKSLADERAPLFERLAQFDRVRETARAATTTTAVTGAESGDAHRTAPGVIVKRSPFEDLDAVRIQRGRRV